MAYMTTDTHADNRPIDAVDSLTEQYTATLLQAVAATDDAWQIDQYTDYQGYLITIIAPPDGSNDLPTFIVSGCTNHIELAGICGEDDLFECGCFLNVEDATAALVAAMTSMSLATISL